MICKHCSQDKPLEEFPKHPHPEGGKSGIVRTKRGRPCKECYNALYRQRYDPIKNKSRKTKRFMENPEKERRTRTNYHFKSKYGITINDYERMLYNQDGRCFLCGKSMQELGYGLYVDHNHYTGEVRKLLCHSCNLGIGLFKEDTELLERVIEYIRIA